MCINFYIASSIVVGSINTDIYKPQPRDTRHEAAALQSVCDCLCEEIAPWPFAKKLYSSFLLDKNQISKILERCEQNPNEAKSYEVFKMLMVVQDKISEEPEILIFDKLCTILKSLNYNNLYTKLKGGW